MSYLQCLSLQSGRSDADAADVADAAADVDDADAAADVDASDADADAADVAVDGGVAKTI